MGLENVQGEQKALDNPAVVEQPASQTTQPTYTPQANTFTNEWQSNIFDCFAPGELCLKACCCPCFVFGKTQARIRDPSLATYERFNTDCLMWAALQYTVGFGWALQFIRRKEMRVQYSLKGDDLSDCLLSWCCTCCALIQQEKEVIGRQSAPVGQGYKPQTDVMVAGPKQA
jgi:Cys-rich protein (TIGR01571 family)